MGKHTIKAYELFGNDEHIVFSETFHKITFLDDKKEIEITISLAS